MVANGATRESLGFEVFPPRTHILRLDRGQGTVLAEPLTRSAKLVLVFSEPSLRDISRVASEEGGYSLSNGVLGARHGWPLPPKTLDQLAHENMGFGLVLSHPGGTGGTQDVLPETYVT